MEFPLIMLDNVRLSQDLSSFKNLIFKIDNAGMQS